MQARQTLVALLAAIAVFYLALFVITKYEGKQSMTPVGPSAASRPASPSAGQKALSQPSSAPAAAESQPAESQPGRAGTQPTGAFRIEGGTSREPVRMGGTEPNSRYPMLLEIDPVGAEVSNAWLRGFYETVKNEKAYQILMEPPDVGGVGSFATPEIRFDDRKLNVSLAGQVWTLDSASTDDKKIWTLQIDDAAGRPLARVEKTYELPPQPVDQRTKLSTYDLRLSLQVRDLSGTGARLILTQSGPVGMRREYSRSEDRMIISGVWKGNSVKTTKYYRTNITKANGVLNIGKDEPGAALAWVAAANNYFTCIMTPDDRKGPDAPAIIGGVEAVTLLSGEPASQEAPSDMTFRFATVPMDLAAGQTRGISFDCYVGPKSKRLFQTIPEYEARDYYAVMTAGFYPCAPTGLTGFMMWLLNTFHRIPPHNYGLAIIMLVLVVRLILHPITKRSQVNMVKMQKQMARLQPKLDAIKQRYAGDRMAMNQAMMQVYKEEGINPAGNLLSCLPMMLQIPIWGALWQALASTIEMRHAPFDGYWIKDLASPDALITFSRPYDIPIISHYLTGPISAFNLLPILLGLSQLLQMKYMPRGTTPGGQTTGPAADQMEQQRKMMMYMSVFFVLMLYSAPSGLNLYIMASNLFGVLEQWRIRKHLADLEAKQAKEPPSSGPSSGPGRGPGPGPGRLPGGPQKPQKQSWLHRKWAELQKQVEEAKKVQGQRPRGK